MIDVKVKKLFEYNDWAWDQVIDAVEQLDERQYMLPRQVFWGSIHGLMVHGLNNEFFWLERCRGNDPGPLFQPDDYAGLEEVKAHWKPVRADFHRYLEELSEDDYWNYIIEHRSLKGNGFSIPLLDVLIQVINHATEHRSQITPILSELGIRTHTTLDYIRFCIYP